MPPHRAWGSVSAMLLLLAVQLACTTTTTVAERPLPTVIHQRRPQGFEVNLPLDAAHEKNKYLMQQRKKQGKIDGPTYRKFINNASNGTTPVHLALYSVVPDIVDRKVYVMFEIWWREWDEVREQVFNIYGPCRGDKHYCANIGPHFWEPYFGDLRCEFIDPDGRVLPGEPSRVEVFSAELLTSATFVGACDMPDTFRDLLLIQHPYTSSAEKGLPGVRVLREGDPGVPQGEHASEGAHGYQDYSGVQCRGLDRLADGDGSADTCRDACIALDRNCSLWQYRKLCYMAADPPMAKACWSDKKFVGGRRRQAVWDAHDTTRENKRLISFGCSMPIFGDGNYMNRIPQWME